MSDYQTILQELKDKLKNGTVSALIGAGFSKNVSNRFPSWNELLYDMVIELYSTEITRGFENVCHLYSFKDEDDYKNYEEAKVKEIIFKEGYLDIVSQYIRKKGYREAVEVYIEDRTPYLDDNNELKFYNKNEVIQLQNSDYTVHSKLLEGNWRDIYTTNYDNLLEKVKDLEGKKWEVITKAYQLSSGKSHNIIKLHGDLCFKSSDEFRFDNDFGRRYIISKEDYDDYPRKHEAFTQLMRIVLLKESFCLFGFSGEDPNFLSWISWVRDILVQDNGNSDFNKVYLVIPAGNTPLSRDKELFYKNHHIVYIPLLSDEVKNIIGAKGNSDIKNILFLLLEYLNHEDPLKPSGTSFQPPAPSEPDINTGNNDILGSSENLNPNIDKQDIADDLQINFDENDSSKYNALWQKIYSQTWRNKNGDCISAEMVAELFQLKKYNRIIKNSWYQEYFLHQAYIWANKEDELALILLALQDTYLLPSFFSGLENKLNEINNFELKEIVDKIRLRKNVLQNNPDTFSNMSSYNIMDADAILYETVLSYAFSFDFQCLKEILNNWQPKGKWIPRKASLLAYFGQNAEEILIDYIRTEPNSRERYYAVQILNSIGGKESTNVYQDRNIEGLTDIKEYILSRLKRNFNFIKPYGQSVTVYDSSAISDSRVAFQFLQFIIESGLPLSAERCNVDYKDWYQVALKLFEEYPYPVLFYSIQYQDFNFLKRLGQEYIYSDCLVTEIENILGKLLRSYLSCDISKQNYFYSNILKIATEFLVAVPPKMWEQNFFTIWEERAVKDYEVLDSGNEIYYFTLQGLEFIENETVISSIIISCLKYAQQNRATTINLLYALAQNHVFISEVAKLVSKKRDLKDTIDQFIGNMSSPQDFMIIGNLNMILTKKQEKAVALKINDFLESLEDVNVKYLYPILFFAKSSPLVIDQIKNIILRSNYIWNNGLKGEWATRPIFIEFRKIKATFNWTEKEIGDLYNKLKESLSSMESYGLITDNFPLSDDYLPLLNDMFDFVCDNHKILNRNKDYDSIKKRLYKLITIQQQFDDISEALMSDDKKIVINGINCLITDIKKDNLRKHIDSIKLVLHRIVLKKEAGLKGCFEFVSYIIENYKPKKIFDKDLILILKVYQGKTCQELELNVPIIYKHLIQISDYLRYNEMRAEEIYYWQNLRKTRRFNNL